MSIKKSFITTSRDDIVAISKILANAVDPKILYDAQHPLMVFLSGTSDCGKKIIADVMHEEILGPAAIEKGNKGHDEYWTGKVGGKRVEVDYIDLFCAWGYTEQKISQAGDGMSVAGNKERQATFTENRKIGGVTIMQNALAPISTGIEIWVEAMDGHLWAATERNGDKLAESGLAERFNEVSSYRDSSDWRSWIRFIEVEITDGRLLNSPKFVKAVESLTSSIGDVKAFIEKVKIEENEKAREIQERRLRQAEAARQATLACSSWRQSVSFFR